jgi:predicted ArsR family transcriptional regulator
VTIKFWLEPLTVVDLLPATAPEIAAQLGITIHQAHGRLNYEKTRGRCVVTDLKVAAAKQTGRGPKFSRLWVAV